jgi:hypothetical protein
VLYTPEGYEKPIIGIAETICTATMTTCDCCVRFAKNTTLTIYYDPQNPTIVFVSDEHTSYIWKMKLFHTVS